jgi:hypothetical protein
MKRRRASDRVAFVEPQAVELHHARVDRAFDEFDRHADARFEQPSRRRRADDDVEVVRRRGAERVDDFDLPGRMSEAVAGDVEEDGRHPSAPSASS